MIAPVEGDPLAKQPRRTRTDLEEFRILLGDRGCRDVLHRPGQRKLQCSRSRQKRVKAVLLHLVEGKGARQIGLDPNRYPGKGLAIG